MQIKHIRKKLGLTQAFVAKKLNVKQAAVSQWENGHTAPRADTLIKLAALFECSVDELVKQ